MKHYSNFCTLEIASLVNVPGQYLRKYGMWFHAQLTQKILNDFYYRSASKTSRRTRNSRSFILEYILGFHHFNISKMLFDSFTFSPQESLSNKLYNLVCNFALQSRSNFGSSKGEVFSEGAFNLVKS